ncbi:MAG: 2-C-methyl-D-erythritol 2,4-cyclodiphosphate synthase [Gemmatimonadales bacterium]
MRVGIGFDSHRFASGRPLVLGGVTIPYPRGLAGHSDADAVAHALADAALGAVNLGDIGRMFPDTDPAWRDADSIGLLAMVHRRVQDEGWTLHQADVTVIAEAPRLAAHVAEMQQRLAVAFGIDAAAISIKAKTNEGMGFIGRAEGIAVIAVVTLVPGLEVEPVTEGFPPPHH